MIPSKGIPMMLPNSFRSVMLTLGVALALVTGAGCASGVRIGTWQVIDPRDPLSITRVELSRSQSVGSTKTLAVNQRLTIDLSNGRSTFTDTDGKVYPQQVDAKVVASLREKLPKLKLKDLKLDEKVDIDPLIYSVKAFDTDATVKREGSWKANSDKPLEPVLKELVDAFDHAFRGAHPLSQDIDLTK